MSAPASKQPTARPPIRFYSTNAPFGEFSNFADYPVVIDGLKWPTSEHYFQACKFTHEDYQERIRLARTADKAARLGRSRSVRIHRNWLKMRNDAMRRAVRAKFQQYASLQALLLSTGDATIVEHTINDSYWGDGGDGRGRNMLGRILMEVRAELALQGAAPEAPPLGGE
ncbi:MAG: NADAR family protein [Candidatus Methylacidiphilales bacterium]